MTRRFRHGSLRARIIWQSLAVLTFAVTATAFVDGQDRQYTLGPTVDLVSGSDSNPINNLTAGIPQTARGPSTFFRLYPAISLASIGGPSTLRASYTLEVAGTRGDTDYNSVSHGASFGFLYPASSKWKLNLTDSFLATSDAASFNGLRGATAPLDQFRFLFDPAALRLSSRSNTADVNTEYTLNPTSILSLHSSYSLRNYGSGATMLNQSLSDQQFVTGGIDYSLKPTPGEAWTVGYTGGYFSFKNFGDIASHTARVAYSVDIARDVKLEVTVGATRVGSLGTSGSLGTAGSSVGYNSSVSITKTKEKDSYSAHYRQDAGQPSGLGSVSDIRNAGVAITHRVGTIELFLDASVYDSQDRFVKSLQIRGVAATASIGIPLTQTLSVRGGAEYQRYDQSALFGFTRQRFFVTLRYDDPKLWTIFR